ncbi:MAG: TIM barrel protein [Phycisphaeraceae bacterium]|nr:MAG: TIM barrel protein [Phycisphaeraceae bacterium]
MNRRDFFAAAAAAGVTVSISHAQPDSSASLTARPAGKGRLKQSVCRWCYGGMPLDRLCELAASIGYRSVELLEPKDWPTVRAHGLDCAVAFSVPSNPIPKGFNRRDHHDSIIKELETRLPLVKEAGIPNQIVFSGNRAGLDDREGRKACAEGLRRITPLAEQLGVTIVMELLNSRVDHGDYMCDRTEWGAALVDEVASDRFRLLYDIYHMQIMEGDVIRTIQRHGKAIGHYHTAGNPGRNEIDDSQELNYSAIAKAIADSGYTGYLGQEFVPRKDPAASLRHAFETCAV